MATAAFWSTGGRTWHTGNAAPPADDPGPDGAEGLFHLILEDSPGAYARFAQNHLEMSPSEAALRAVYQSHPLDPSTLSALNPDADYERVREQLDELGLSTS